MKVVIFGNGNVAKATASLLRQRLQQASTQHQAAQSAQIYMIGRHHEAVLARTDDINLPDTAGPLVNVIASDRPWNVAGADLIIFTMGISAGKTGATDRNENLQYNLPIIQQYAPYIKEHASTALILMLTNPVETTAWYMQQQVSPNNMVVGLGLALDSLRFTKNLMQQYSARGITVTTDKVKVPVIGLHQADGMHFLQDMQAINNNGLSNKALQGILTATTRKTKQEGFCIVKHSGGNGAALGPAMVACNFSMAFLFGMPMLTYAAVNNLANKIPGLTDPEVFIGVPVVVNKKNISVALNQLKPNHLHLLEEVCVSQQKLIATCRASFSRQNRVFASLHILTSLDHQFLPHLITESCFS